MASESLVSANATSALAFTILSHIDPNVPGPRLGKLIVPKRKEVDTPNFFVVGSRGVVPHLTPDVISEHVGFGGIHVALEDCKWASDYVNKIPSH